MAACCTRRPRRRKLRPESKASDKSVHTTGRARRWLTGEFFWSKLTILPGDDAALWSHESVEDASAGDSVSHLRRQARREVRTQYRPTAHRPSSGSTSGGVGQVLLCDPSPRVILSCQSLQKPNDSLDFTDAPPKRRTRRPGRPPSTSLRTRAGEQSSPWFFQINPRWIFLRRNRPALAWPGG